MKQVKRNKSKVWVNTYGLKAYIMACYNLEGCPYTLVSKNYVEPNLPVGAVFTRNNTTYKITHIFHDCIAIKEIKNE